MSEEIPIGPNPCFKCGGEYGKHRSGCSSLTEQSKYLVRYVSPKLGKAVVCGDWEKVLEAAHQFLDMGADKVEIETVKNMVFV